MLVDIGILYGSILRALFQRVMQQPATSRRIGPNGISGSTASDFCGFFRAAVCKMLVPSKTVALKVVCRFEGHGLLLHLLKLG